MATGDEPAPVKNVDSKLMLTHDEWLERYKQQDQESGRGGSSSGGRDKRRVRGRGHGQGGGSNPCNASKMDQSNTSDPCKSCGKLGHWAKDCRSRSK